jgi:hypothetical protein
MITGNQTFKIQNKYSIIIKLTANSDENHSEHCYEYGDSFSQKTVHFHSSQKIEISVDIQMIIRRFFLPENNKILPKCNKIFHSKNPFILKAYFCNKLIRKNRSDFKM